MTPRETNLQNFDVSFHILNQLVFFQRLIQIRPPFPSVCREANFVLAPFECKVDACRCDNFRSHFDAKSRQIQRIRSHKIRNLGQLARRSHELSRADHVLVRMVYRNVETKSLEHDQLMIDESVEFSLVILGLRVDLDGSRPFALFFSPLSGPLFSSFEHVLNFSRIFLNFCR